MQYLLETLAEPLYCTLPPDHVMDLPSRITRVAGTAHESLAEAHLVLQSRGVALEQLPLVLACVRDPYELEVSRYAFLRQDLNSYNHTAQQALALLGSFELFATVSAPHGDQPIESYFLLDGVVPDNLRIIRLENADRELAGALEQAGVDTPELSLPRRNQSSHEAFERYFTPAAEEAVYEKYKWVFDAGLYPRLRLAEQSSPCSSPGPESFLESIRATRGGKDDRRDGLSRTYACLAAAEIHRHWGNLAAEQAELEAAVRHARETDSERLISRTAQASARSWSLSGPRTVSEGIAACRALLEQPVGTLEMTAGRLVLAELLAAEGRFDEARSLLEGRPRRRQGAELAAASAATSVELLAGENLDAERRSRGARPWNTARFVAGRAEALCAVENYSAAEPLISFAERTTAASDVPAQARWRRSRATLLLAEGEAGAALARGTEAVSLAAAFGAPNLHADALVDLATTLSAVGRPADAAPILHQAVGLYERKGNTASSASAAGRLRSARLG